MFKKQSTLSIFTTLRHYIHTSPPRFQHKSTCYFTPNSSFQHSSIQLKPQPLLNRAIINTNISPTFHHRQQRHYRKIHKTTTPTTIFCTRLFSKPCNNFFSPKPASIFPYTSSYRFYTPYQSPKRHKKYPDTSYYQDTEVEGQFIKRNAWITHCWLKISSFISPVLITIASSHPLIAAFALILVSPAIYWALPVEKQKNIDSWLYLLSGKDYIYHFTSPQLYNDIDHPFFQYVMISPNELYEVIPPPDYGLNLPDVFSSAQSTSKSSLGESLSTNTHTARYNQASPSIPDATTTNEYPKVNISDPKEYLILKMKREQTRCLRDIAYIKNETHNLQSQLDKLIHLIAKHPLITSPPPHLPSTHLKTVPHDSLSEQPQPNQPYLSQIFIPTRILNLYPPHITPITAQLDYLTYNSLIDQCNDILFAIKRQKAVLNGLDYDVEWYEIDKKLALTLPLGTSYSSTWHQFLTKYWYRTHYTTLETEQLLKYSQSISTTYTKHIEPALETLGDNKIAIHNQILVPLSKLLQAVDTTYLDVNPIYEDDET